MSYDNDNIFAKLLRGEIPSETVYEDADTLQEFRGVLSEQLRANPK